MDTKTLISEKLDEFGNAVVDMRERLTDRIERLEANQDRPRGTDDPNSKAFNQALTKFLLTGEKEVLRECKEMTIGTDSSGGYTHIAELGPQIVDAVSTVNPIMANCEKVVIDANVYHRIYSTSRNATARAAEGDTRSATNTATFAQNTVTLYDLYAYPSISNELLRSSQFDLERWIRQDVSLAFDDALATEFVTGDGSSKSVGLLNSMSTNTLNGSPDLPWGSLYFVSGQSSPEAVNYTGLVNTVQSLPVRYKQAGNAKWYMSTSAIEDARKLLDQNDLPIWRQDYGVAGAPMVLLGYPVVEVPALDSQSYRVLFGDMRQAYAFVSHSQGVGVIVDQITSPGTTKFYISLQCAGGVMDSRAMVAIRG
jgi:HK97 family phage major capsid protein